MHTTSLVCTWDEHLPWQKEERGRCKHHHHHTREHPAHWILTELFVGYVYPPNPHTMAAGRPVLGLVSLILIAGGIVMTFFVVLSGFINNVVPIKNTWFLQAQTTNISGGNSNLKNPARWTYLAICGVTNGYNANCGPTTAALPFAPAHNFGTTSGVPAAFTGNHFYYLSRFAWVFYLISLFFAVVSFFLGFLALCTRLGAYLTGLNAAIALFFQALAASLMT